MAQFQIIDEYDVEVCKLPYEKALSFCDYLNSIGIKAKAKEGYSNFYIIYVTNEADKLKAKLELVRHSDSAFFKEFEKASWKSGKTVSSRKRLNSNSLPFTYNLFSVVSIVQILCVIVYVLSLIDQDLVIFNLALGKFEQFTNPINYYKLFTPALVHFSLMHIAFNLIMFEALGRPIENNFGSVKMFSLVVGIAAISNVFQYIFTSDQAVFGGLSGVVYGLIGYSAVISLMKKAPSNFKVIPGLFAVSFIFILFGFFLNGIANVCHLSGLLLGSLIALFDCKFRLK